jgi:RHS repeat-associated protein
LLSTRERDGSGYTYAPPPCTGIFNDVPCPSGFANWIEEVYRRGITAGCGGGNFCPSTQVTRDQMAVFISKTWGYLTPTASATRRNFIYDQAMHLIGESSLTSAFDPGIAYEHLWLGDRPMAEEDLGGQTYWTVTDHLGTPFMETFAAKTTAWRIESEPYGWVYSLRSGSDRHQPLRFPGQEAEELNTGGTTHNGATEKRYNIFRWYHPKWGRYSQVDRNLRPRPEEPNPFGYVADRPVTARDPFGLNIVYNASCQPVLVKSEEGSQIVVVPRGGAAFADGFYNATPLFCGRFCGAGSGDRVRKINDLTDVVITGGCDGKCLNWSYANPSSVFWDLDPRTGWKGDDWFAKHPDWPRPDTPPNNSCCK